MATIVVPILLIGCASASSSGSGEPSVVAVRPSASPTAVASVPATPTAPVTTPDVSSAAPATTGSCLPRQNEVAVVVPTEGRCKIDVRGVALTLAPPTGWIGGTNGVYTVFAPDSSGSSVVRMYRYGGAVVPHYCTDPAPGIPMAEGSAIVEWVQELQHLDSQVVGRSVGPYPAWQLDLAANSPPSCSGDPGKAGAAYLWKVDGEDGNLPRSVSGTDRIRVYLVEKDATILMIEATAPGEELTAFALTADRIFGSIVIE